MWLSYSEDIFRIPDGSVADTDQNVVAEQVLGTTPGYQFRWFGSNVAAVIVGGDIAEGAARGGRAAQIDYAKQAVAAAFGSSTLDKFQSAASSQWLMDPYSQGCYTYAIPGGVPARATLADTAMAKALLAKQIFFAGRMDERTARRCRHTRRDLTVPRYGNILRGRVRSNVCSRTTLKANGALPAHPLIWRS
jgi:hypothetical protein